ncbi:DUF6302 family protein [Streptomyces sp. NPDC020875]|uniref:DUF6302 family protein n=1 Tax=Streptomyces sp. NPDC020875 TaxID=3154898 RepID=UPI0033C770E3
MSVLPAAMAYDYEWVAGRLLDPVVLGGAVALALFRAPLLAVPAGGCRLGGYVDAVDERTAHEVVAVLGGRPGFSGLRLRTVSGPVAKVLVEWGERVPEGLDARARARFYGFRAPAAGAGVAPGGGHLGSGPSRAVRDRLAGVGRRRGSPVRFRRRPLPGSSTGAVRDEGPERRPEAAASGAAPAR